MYKICLVLKDDFIDEIKPPGWCGIIQNPVVEAYFLYKSLEDYENGHIRKL